MSERDLISNDEATFESTVGAVQSAISPSIRRDTYIFTIRVVTDSPEKSALIANTLAELYIEDQIRVKFEATEGAVAWLSDRVVALEAEIQEREDAIKEVQSQADFASTEGLTALNRQVRDIRDRLEQQRVAADQAAAELASLREARDAGDPGRMVSSANDATLRRIAADLPDGTPLAADGSFLARYDVLVSRAETEAERAAAQAEALAGSLSQLEQRLDTQSNTLARLQQMQRELQATSVLYETFLSRLKETTVQQGIQQADARVLSSAVGGTMIEPRKSRILVLGILLGTMVGSGIVLLREMTRRGFRTPDALENETGYPVIGQIPKIPIRSRSQLIDYLNDKPTSAAAEAVRNLRTSVLLSNVDQPPCVIMSTSSIPGEGKTTQAIALTHNLAGLGKKVLLVEGDVRRRTFTQYFSSTGGAGILSVLSGDVPLDEAVWHDERLNADVLMGEKTNVNAADVFSSDRFAQFMSSVRETYDFVIVDTPPVLVVPDARVIGQHCDAIVYSVGWDSTVRNQVVDGLKELASVNLWISGLVLAQIDPRGMKRYGYGGRYGAYSRYGRGYYEA